MRVTISDRRTRYTASPSGLLFGLFGTLVAAVFTYLITVTPDGAFLLDPNRTVTMFTDLTRLGSLPPVRWPLVLLTPVLPVIYLVVVPLCSLSASRHVGAALLTRTRLTWLVLIGLVTALGVLATTTVAQQSHWLGGLIVLIALALPHHEDPQR
jgi:hypothetical protein